MGMTESIGMLCIAAQNSWAQTKLPFVYACT